MQIQITNEQTKIQLQEQIVLKKAQTVLNALEYPDHELSLLFVDDNHIAEINESYRNKKGPTNVIAFAMQEGEFSGISPLLLGDVVISADTAQKEADTAGITVHERISQLLVHGILHLVGYDHERGEDDALVMEKKSLELIRLIEDNSALAAF